MPATPEPPPLPPSVPSYPRWPVWPGWQDALALQQIKDGEHLRVLSICHYIVGGLAILFSSIFIVHIVLGISMLKNPRFFDAGTTRTHRPAITAPAATPDDTPAADPDATPTPTPRSEHRPHRPENFPPAFGYMFIGMGSVAVLLGWTMGALTIYSGRCLARRRRRVFSLVVAGINCLHVPFGTALGVFTFIVLQRPTVQALYAPGRQN